jgi:hypothetical protein
MIISWIILRQSSGIVQYILGETAEKIMSGYQKPQKNFDSDYFRIRVQISPVHDESALYRERDSMKPSGQIFRKRVVRVAGGAGSSTVRVFLLAVLNLRTMLETVIFVTYLLT